MNLLSQNLESDRYLTNTITHYNFSILTLPYMIEKLIRLYKIFTEETTMILLQMRPESMALYQDLLTMKDREVKAPHLIDPNIIKIHQVTINFCRKNLIKLIE